MKTMSAFVSYQSSFNNALSKFAADPEASPTGQSQAALDVLSRFEINYNHNTKVSALGCRNRRRLTCRSFISTP